MSLENKKPVEDIENIEHHDIAEAKQVVALGKTTSGDFLPFLVDNDVIIFKIPWVSNTRPSR